MQRKTMCGESKELAIATLSCIGDGVISTDLAGKIIYMNKIAEEIVDCNAEDALNREFLDVFYLCDAITKDKLDSPIDYVLKNEMNTGLTNNASIILKNNVQKYISATCSPIRDGEGKMVGVVVIFRDITRLKTFELNHLDEEKNLKSIFDNTPAGMLTIDSKFYIVKANEAVLRYTNLKNTDITGKRFGEGINCVSSYENEKGCGYGEKCPV
ncbi:MAG: PAS domain-containing protein, partial [Mobilitalea sp.]